MEDVIYARQYISSFIAAGGAFACGLCIAWTALLSNQIQSGDAYGFTLSDEEYSWVASILNLGAASMCIPMGFLINFIGRKSAMLLMIVPFTIGWLTMMFGPSLIALYVGRYLLGVAGGAFCIAAPMYIGEITAKEIRGTCGSFFDLLMTIGILLEYVIGGIFNVFMSSLLSGFVTILYGVCLMFIPESPTYLVGRDKMEKAAANLQWLRGTAYNPDAELAEIKAENEAVQSVLFWESMSRRNTRKSLFMALGLMLFQQMSGINAIIFYAGSILERAKTGIDTITASFILALLQVLATFVTIISVDTLGRKLFLFASGAAMMVYTICIGIYFKMQSNDENSVTGLGWLLFTSICIYIVMFSMGFGPVPWLMLGEIFLVDVKGPAGSIAGTVNWCLSFVITKTFVNMQDLLGVGEIFWVFSGFCFLSIFFTKFCVLETKGKSLQEIQVEIDEKGFCHA